MTPILAGAFETKINPIETRFLVPLWRCTSATVLYDTSPAELVVDAAAAAVDHACSAYDAVAGAVSNMAYDSFAIYAPAFEAAMIAARNVSSIYPSAYMPNVLAGHRGSTASSVWNAVSKDASAFDMDQSGGRLFRSPLWHDDDEPTWSQEQWIQLKSHLLSREGENWQVWTDWWEARRDGKPYNIDMEREIVLLPDVDWEKGPAHVNGLIADIRAKYAKRDSVQEALLQERVSEPLARISIAEFNYDQIDHVMRMLPFAEEMAKIETPSCTTMLSELMDAAQDLADDIHQSQAPVAVKRTLRRYAEEAGKDPASIRPGRLHDLGKLLRKARSSPDILGGLPDLTDDALRAFVDKHLQFMRGVMASTLVRMEQMENVIFSVNGNAETVAEGLDLGAAAIRGDGWTTVPPASDEAAVIMRDIALEIRELAAERDATFDEGKRAKIQDDIDDKGKTGGSTLIRYSLRAVGATAQTINLAAAGKTLWPETFKTALDLVVAQFSGFKLPW